MTDATQTTQQLNAEFSLCADYDVTCDVVKARRFLVACRRLLNQVEQVGKGSAQMRIQTEKYERLIRQTQSWLQTNGGTSSGGRQRGSFDAVMNDGNGDDGRYV